ncbi:MAG: copper chaperone PCu(A)C [Microthrixaceae bacterium]
MSISTPRTRRFGLGLVAVLALTAGLAACSSDDSSSTTTTAKSSASTTEKSTTTTTAPGTLITVSDVWTPPAAAGESTKVYLSITGGAAADELVSVSVPKDLAESAALVPDAPVDLPATQTVDLTDEGAYIEVTGLKKALEENAAFEVTLTFGTEPAQTVQGAVREADEGIS